MCTLRGTYGGVIKMRNSTWAEIYDPSENSNTLLFGGSEESLPPLRPDCLHKAFLKIPGDSWKEKLDYCASCKCCTRHQTFRPTRLIHWTDDMATRDIPISQLTPCKCNCRHLARFICRSIGTTCPVSGPLVEDMM